MMVWSKMVIVRVHGKIFLSIYFLSASVPPYPVSPALSQQMGCPCFLLWPASALISWIPFLLTLRTLLLHLFPLFLLTLIIFFNVLDHFCLHPNTSSILKAKKKPPKPSLNPTSQAASPLFCSFCSVPQKSFLYSPSLFFLLILILF